MYNDFVVVGPKADPAGVKGKDVVEALRKLSTGNASFISRGDKSGTHAAELRFWKAVGVDPPAGKVPGYKECGCGMGPALNIASSSNAYALTDRGTWLNFKNRGELAILVEGDTKLFNQYGVIVVNPAKHPHVKNRTGAGVRRLGRVGRWADRDRRLQDRWRAAVLPERQREALSGEVPGRLVQNSAHAPHPETPVAQGCGSAPQKCLFDPEMSPGSRRYARRVIRDRLRYAGRSRRRTMPARPDDFRGLCVALSARSPGFRQRSTSPLETRHGHARTRKIRNRCGIQEALRQLHRRPVGGAGEGPVLREHLAGHRQGVLRDRRARPPRTSNARSTPPMPPRPPGARPRRPSARTSSTRSPTAWRQNLADAGGGRDLGQRQADPRDDGRRHAAGHRPLPLLRRLHPRAGRRASARSTTTPSPTTSTSRSASSARSSRGTSRS